MFNEIKSLAHQLLSRLGKIFGLDLPYFVKNHFFLSGATIINIISGFILSLLYAHVLDKTTYGQYVLIFSFITTLGVTRLTGMQSIFPYAITSGNEGFFPRVQKISFLTSLAGTAALLGIAVYYFLPGKPPLGPILLITALIFPFINSLIFYDSFLQSKKMFAISSFYSILQAIIPNLAIALTVIFLPKTFWLILAALVPQVVLNIYFTLKTLKKVNNHQDDGRDFLYGIKLSLVYFPAVLILNLDDFLLAKFLGFEQLAIYAFAMAIPQQLAPFLKNFETLAVPKLGDLPDQTIAKDIPKKIGQMMVLTLIFVIAYIVTIPYFFHLFYPKYVQSILPSQIYSLTLIFYPVFLITQSFHRLRLFRHTAIINWSIVITKLILLVVLIPRFGVLGAASSAVILQMFTLLFAFIMLRTVKSA